MWKVLPNVSWEYLDDIKIPKIFWMSKLQKKSWTSEENFWFHLEIKLFETEVVIPNRKFGKA